MTSFFADQQDFLTETLNDLIPEPPCNELTLEDGTRITRVGLGVIQFEPRKAVDNTLLLFSAAIHGNETAPIEVCNQLVNDLVSGNIQVQRPTLFILGNPPAMRIGQRFVDENLNRLFLGKHAAPEKTPNLETVRANQLEQWVDQFIEQHPQREALWHYDLHTAIRGSHREKFALYPFVPNRKPPASQLTLLEAADVKTVLLQATPAGTFSALTSVRYHAESFTIELGSVRPFGQNDLTQYLGIHTALQALIEGQESTLTVADTTPLELFEVCHEILNTGESFELNIADDVWNFTEFKHPDIIWKDAHQTYQVGETSEYIVFPNKQVPTGQRAGLMLKKTPLSS